MHAHWIVARKMRAFPAYIARKHHQGSYGKICLGAIVIAINAIPRLYGDGPLGSHHPCHCVNVINIQFTEICGALRRPLSETLL